MANPFYCELYIDIDESWRTMEGADDLASQCGESGELWKLGIEVIVYRNDDFNPEARWMETYDFISCSNYFAETSASVQDAAGRERFENEVVKLVMRLRELGHFITAVTESDEFEERLVAETGWNWTRDQPEPPGREKRR